MPQIQVGGRDPELSDRLSHELISYNVDKIGVSGTALSIKAIDDDGGLIAGLDGVSWGTALHIESLWVHADHRADGWGRRLMDAAETEARNRGCTDMSVCSFTFQAPDFYKRLGFVETGQRIGYPNGSADVVMWKGLGGEEPVELVVVVDYQDDSAKGYEDAALDLVTKHRGRVERRLQANDGRSEVQILWFPNRAAHEGFRSDPDRNEARAATRRTSRVIQI